MEYFNIEKGTVTKKYLVTESFQKPYMKVSDSVLPLTTSTTNGVQLKVTGSTGAVYRPLEYLSTSGSASYLTTQAGSEGMSNVTALTRASTSDTVYYTRASTSDTVYYTRASTSDTVYYTRSETTGTTYLTRVSTSGTTYQTRASTSATLTRASTSATLTRASTSATLTCASTSATLTRASTSATLTRASTSATLTRASTSATLTRASTSATLYATDYTSVKSSSFNVWQHHSNTYAATYWGWKYIAQNNVGMKITNDCKNNKFTFSVSNTNQVSLYRNRVSTSVNSVYWYTSTGYTQTIAADVTILQSVANTTNKLYPTNTVTSNYAYHIIPSNITSLKTAEFHASFNIPKIPTILDYTESLSPTLRATGYATRTSASGYATRTSASGYATRTSASGYATRSSISGYGTRVSTSGYGTRSSISGYGTRVSTSGYATRASTSNTVYGTCASTSGTNYGTRSSTSATEYKTRVSTSATEYKTRVSTSGTEYLTRESTSGYSGVSSSSSSLTTWC